ncbi:hypothetical protein FRC02_002278 [Tulasnella sp. 418]|nr:hypothetical protein FRC02_002278 [Tulasnella sp. 418]
MSPPWTEVYLVDHNASPTEHLSLKRRIFVKVFRKLSKTKRSSSKTLPKTSIAAATLVASTSVSCFNDSPTKPQDVKMPAPAVIALEPDVIPELKTIVELPKKIEVEESCSSSVTSQSRSTLYSITEEREEEEHIEEREAEEHVEETLVEVVAAKAEINQETAKVVVLEDQKCTEVAIQERIPESTSSKSRNRLPTPALVWLGTCTTLSIIVAARYTIFGRS